MRTFAQGRHENGQNFLTHQPTLKAITRLVAATRGPIIEVGPGAGALTNELEKLHRPLTAVDIDARLAEKLQRRSGKNTTILCADFLRYSLPDSPHIVVGNLPFSMTTAILRKILHSRHTTDAILLIQWEVARRRAGVGGSTMMTAQWAPFYTFALGPRVPARAFTPSPGVDGGVLSISRRGSPLLPWTQQRKYAEFIRVMFTGGGRGVGQILRNTQGISSSRARNILASASVSPRALPKDLTAQQWASLWKHIANAR